MNPAVTLAFAVVRRLDWIKVPVYWLAQLLGAFIASAIVYGIYYGRFEMWASLLAWYVNCRKISFKYPPPFHNPPFFKISITPSFGPSPVDTEPSTIFSAHSQDV